MQPFALDAAVKSLAAAESAGTVFNVLVEALAGAAPRGAIFLARQGEIRGWSSFGYSAEATRMQSAFSSPLHAGRLGRLIADPTPDVERITEGDPNFGQGKADESLLTTVSVKGKPIAAILVERDVEEQPWDPSALALLTTVARMRLELTLAQRKLQAAENATAATSAAAASPARNTATTPDARSIRDTPDGHGERKQRRESEQPMHTAATAVAESPTAPDETPNLEWAAARRFARLVATDIRLYNEEAVALGRRHRDLAERLKPAIARGRESFVERHGDLGNSGLELLHEAYVNVLAGGDAGLLPASLLKLPR